MQAIRTRVLLPTNTKPTRIKASCAAGSITIPYSYEGDTQTCHAEAAMQLVRKLGWEHTYIWVCGQLDNGDYCFVGNVPEQYYSPIDD